MAFTLTHPARGTVTVQTETRRDVLVSRGFVEDKPKPAPKAKAPKPPTEKPAEKPAASE